MVSRTAGRFRFRIVYLVGMREGDFQSLSALTIAWVIMRRTFFLSSAAATHEDESRWRPHQQAWSLATVR
jgi:hypothetical protein